MAELNQSQRSRIVQDALNVCRPLNLSSQQLFTALRELNNAQVNELLGNSKISITDLQQCGNELNALEQAEKAVAAAPAANATPAPDTAPAATNTSDKNAALDAEFKKFAEGKDARTINAGKVQLELKRSGLLDGNIDGVFGDKTRAALGKVTGDNMTPALAGALNQLDINRYYQNNQAAINAAKGKISNNAAPEKLNEPVAKASDRETQIKTAQTALAKAGYYGAAAQQNLDSVADGKIGAQTKAAMEKANDAIVKATANGNACPPELQGAATALEGLKKLQREEPAKAVVKETKPEPRKEQETAEEQKKRSVQKGTRGSVQGQQVKREPYPRNDDTNERQQPRGGAGAQPHVNNRGEEYGNQVVGMNRKSDREIVARLGAAYKGAPIYHIGPKLPEIRDIHKNNPRAQVAVPSLEKDLVPLQTAPSPGHPQGQTVWVPNGWHFKLDASLRKNNISLNSNQTTTYSKNGAVLDGATLKPVVGLSPDILGAFGVIFGHESGPNGEPSGVQGSGAASPSSGLGGGGKGGGTGATGGGPSR